MKMSLISLNPLVVFLAGVLTATATARPLAIGPNGVDGGDLTGDAANNVGETRSVWAGTHGVAAWLTNAPNSTLRMMAARFGAGGELLAPPVALVENVGATSLALSYSSGEILVVWQASPGGALARRMTPNLAWLDAAPVVLLAYSPAQTYQYLTFNSAANALRHGVIIRD